MSSCEVLWGSYTMTWLRSACPSSGSSLCWGVWGVCEGRGSEVGVNEGILYLPVWCYWGIEPAIMMLPVIGLSYLSCVLFYFSSFVIEHSPLVTVSPSRIRVSLWWVDFVQLSCYTEPCKFFFCRGVFFPVLIVFVTHEGHQESPKSLSLFFRHFEGCYVLDMHTSKSRQEAQV